MRTTANAAIKGQASKLSVSQFIRDRETVEQELFKALKIRLEGLDTNHQYLLGCTRPRGLLGYICDDRCERGQIVKDPKNVPAYLIKQNRTKVQLNPIERQSFD